MFAICTQQMFNMHTTHAPYPHANFEFSKLISSIDLFGAFLKLNISSHSLLFQFRVGDEGRGSGLGLTVWGGDVIPASVL